MSEPPTEYEDDGEVVEALPVLAADVREVTPVRPQGAAVIQTAAVAATGFVAGIATAAVLGRALQRQVGQLQARRAVVPAPRESLELLSTRTFLVNVHLLGRREEP